MSPSSAAASVSTSTPDAPPTVPRRLVVELTRKSATALTELVEVEDLNKTTIVNRAIQVYQQVTDLQRRGGTVIFEDPAAGVQQRLLIV